MCEMLGNQYFLARRYFEAVGQFEKVLLLDSENDSAKRKLIICYIQTNEIGLALKLFSDLINKNIDIILNSDSDRDDCPCRQMIHELENYPTSLNDYEKSIVLGILWLYCDIDHSREYFNSVVKKHPDKNQIRKISQIINYTFLKTKKENSNGKKSYFA